MASAQPAHDPALSQVPPPASNAQQPPGGQSTQGAGRPNITGHLIPGIPNDQVMHLLKHIPGFFEKQDGWKDSIAAETLSNLSQTVAAQQQVPQTHPTQFPPHGMNPHQQSVVPHNGMASEPGPSSHPRGPPNLGQLSAAASALQTNPPQPSPSGEGRPPPQDEGAPQGSPSPIEGGSPDDERPAPATKTSGRRGGRSATMTNDEWARLRKDNHKEVERRRRGNINEGINELGRIVPNGSGEKAKGAILSRAVQYIHHLKENEARNIEKWTLEKLLMDQAMGDLQAQLDEMRRMWEEERVSRQRAEAELELLRGHGSSAGAGGASVPSAGAGGSAAAAEAPSSSAKENGKRGRDESDAPDGEAAKGQGGAAEGDDRTKRSRVE